MERAFNAWLRYWRVRPDETIGSLVVGFVKISDV
jgi:hypothetical protein